MGKGLAYGILSLAFFSFFTASALENSIHIHLATCKGLVDHVEFTLDFFEEVDEGSGKSSGSGVVVQTMRQGDSEAKSLARIDVQENGDSKRDVVMYAVLNPDTVFARFSMNIRERSSLEIYALNFGAVWGIFDCTPGLLAH